MSVGTPTTPGASAAARLRARLARLLASTIGLKAQMAVTGLLLVGFLIAHLAGNLTLFAGQEATNAYAVKVKSLGPLLWLMRGGLLLVAIVHVVAALRLRQANQAARPVRYAHETVIQTTPMARSMVLTGLVVLAFSVYHLAHFTWGWTHPEHHALVDAKGRHDVFSMVVLGFRQPAVTLSYAIAMALLGMHLAHGVQSLFQSLGLNDATWYPAIRTGGRVLAAALALGFLALPVCVLLDLITLPDGAATAAGGGH